MNHSSILEKSVIVCAHPDDEVLWFSSILDKVNEIVVCFLGMKSEPNGRPDRQRSLSSYPLKNISCLGLDESETVNGVDWDNPVLTQYGIEISNKRYSEKTYKKNYYELKEQLKEKLSGCSNVFTHNPWGEYGNDEHIQIYRVIEDLQPLLKFNVWFSNYASNKSYKLMLNYIEKKDLSYITLPTNKELADSIKHLYQKNNCWTWYDDWKWFEDESFLMHPIFEEKGKNPGRIFPVNFIRVWMPNRPAKRFTFPNLSFLKFLKRRSQNRC